jgi:AAA+ superfamily predicted ATPase
LPIDSEEERERELMSIETTIVSAMGKIGNVSDVDRVLQGKNGFFSPTKYPDADGPTGAMGRVLFVDRFSGARALCIQVSSVYLLSDADLATMNKWADGKNHSSVFARVQFRGHNLGGDSEFKIYVECNVPLAGLREEFLVEVINDSLRLWQEAMRYVERLNRCIEREKAERKQTEVNEQKVMRTVLHELDALVGLQSVKHMVRGLIAQQTVAKKRKATGLPVLQASPHLVFSGNPGTGKTTVARLVGRLYKDIGLLSKGHVVEVGRAELIGGYIGQTAIRTKNICEKALGGVLFIDEAYSLDVDGRDDGQEAIETILTFMEEHRGEIVVIVAGYPKEMEKFLDSNPGLRSRFDTAIQFDDYSVKELMQIFESLLVENQYDITDGARRAVVRHLMDLHVREVGGNARLVRNVFQQLVAQQAMSLAGLETLTVEQMRLITIFAIPAAWGVNTDVSLDELPPLVVGE